MTGCSVTSISASGVRQVLIRLRLASASECRTSRSGAGVAVGVDGGGARVGVVGRWCVMPRPPSGRRCRRRRGAPVRVKKTSSRLGRCRESSVTRDAGRGEPGDGRRSGPRRRSTGTASTPLRSVGLGAPPADLGAGSPRRRRSRAGSAGRTSRVWPPTTRLSPSGVSCAMTRPWSMTRDLVGERVGLLQVLGGEQHRRAVADQACGRRPTCPRAWPGRGRWSARRGRSRRAGRPGWRPGRAGAACRRSRSWPAGPRRRSGRTSRAARRPAPWRPARAGRAACRSAPGSAVPVRSSSTEAYWPVRPMRLADPLGVA